MVFQQAKSVPGIERQGLAFLSLFLSSGGRNGRFNGKKCLFPPREKLFFQIALYRNQLLSERNDFFKMAENLQKASFLVQAGALTRIPPGYKLKHGR